MVCALEDGMGRDSLTSSELALKSFCCTVRSRANSREANLLISHLYSWAMESGDTGKDNRKRAAAAASLDSDDYVEEPSNTDVVVGRGSAQSWRPGNVRFHDYLDQICPRYQSARSKRAKRTIVKEVYDNITASGHFVEKELSGERYIIIDEDEAMEKIACAIRYRKKRVLKAKAEMAKRHKNDEAAQRSEVEEDAKMEAAPARESHADTSVSIEPPEHAPDANDAVSTASEIFSDEDLASVLLPDMAREQELQQPQQRSTKRHNPPG